MVKVKGFETLPEDNVELKKRQKSNREKREGGQRYNDDGGGKVVCVIDTHMGTCWN